jgi:predicted ATPase
MRSKDMFITCIKAKNWKNFRNVDVELGERAFLIGPNASGKSNFLDIFRFMRDIVKPGGGLQKAVIDRGGLSKIRCLGARQDPEVEVEFHFSESLECNSKTKFKYILAIRIETRGKRRTLITREEVHKNGIIILQRPDENDKKDNWRLIQTNLEQISVNLTFREIYDYFNSVRYLHIVPQLLRYSEMFFNTSVSKGDDSFGFHFLENIMDTGEGTRKSRLKKIEEALKIAVPQLKGFTITRDERGVPHLEATYEHWRPKAGKQQESQFSDGTIRLIGFLWSILETNSLLLLEEPELSLNSSIVSRLPALVYRIVSKKKKKQQILFSTHSLDMLSDKGIAGEEILLFIPGKEGTRIKTSSTIREIRLLLEQGLSPAEVIVAYTEPKNIRQLSLFE